MIKHIEILPSVILVNAFDLEKKEINKSAVEVYFSAGGRYYEKGRRGVRHILEHCLAKNQQQYFVDQELAFNNINRNAGTGQFMMSTTASGFDDSVEIQLKLCLVNLNFNDYTKGHFEKERKIVLSEIKPKLQRDLRVKHEEFYRFIIEDYNVVGKSVQEVVDVEACNLEDLEREYEQIISQSKIIINVMGVEIDPEKVKMAFLENIEFYDKFKASQNKIIGRQKTKMICLDNKHFQHEALASTISLEYSFNNFDERFRKFGALLSNYLCYPVFGKLDKRLRQQLNYVYGVSFGADSNMDTYSISFNIEEVNLEDCLLELKKALENLVTEFEPELFNGFTKRLLTDLRYQNTLANWQNAIFMSSLLDGDAEIETIDDLIKFYEAVTEDEFKVQLQTLADSLLKDGIYFTESKVDVKL